MLSGKEHRLQGDGNTQRDDEVKEYIGLTEPPFKHRYANHKTSFDTSGTKIARSFQSMYGTPNAVTKTLPSHGRSWIERKLTVTRLRDVTFASRRNLG